VSYGAIYTFLYSYSILGGFETHVVEYGDTMRCGGAVERSN
jgi:hypothetical protein